jgi:xylitol oxidase
MSITGRQLINWSGSQRYRAGELHRPESLDELRRLLAGHGGSLQVLATRHTFTAMGDADALIGLDRLPGAGAIDIDADTMTATVGPAVTYAQLAVALGERGLALANLASLPHISVVGAIATATHGSGDEWGNLATAVCGLTLLTADGDTVVLRRGDPRLAGAAVHLGALGVVLSATLDVVPGYELRQDVFLDLEWDALAEHFDAVMGAGRSVSVFHDFGARTREVWIKGDPAAADRADLFGARPALTPHSPVPDGLPANCTAQLGVAGPWSERLPHFRSGFTPSAGAEIQSEFFVARADALPALAALRPLADVISPVLQIAELRTIAADELWLSPEYHRDSAALHFTWHLEPGAVAAVCARVQDALAPFAPRPHWGKLYTGAAPEYPRAAEWRALRAELDPRGALVNDWLRTQGHA